MELTPDAQVLVQIGPVAINATIAFSWAIMAVLVLGARLLARHLDVLHPGRAQAVGEVVVAAIRAQIRAVTEQDPGPYLPFIGTLYLFIAVANLLAFVPGYHPPTASLSTTAALAGCVFLAVPIYSIRQVGVTGYLRHYIEPTPLMLPFQVLSEISRTVALAVRLFGNVMSGMILGGILISLAPLLLPVPLRLLELVIGQVQAYIFAVLATVYIASAARSQGPVSNENHQQPPTLHGAARAKGER